MKLPSTDIFLFIRDKIIAYFDAITQVKPLLFLILLIFHTSAHALQTNAPDFILKHYTDENGLPQNSIKSIIKDENGFIWLTTEDRVIRFDGQTFKIFNKKNLKTSSNRFGHFISVYGEKDYYVENAEKDFFYIKGGKVYPAGKRKKRVNNMLSEIDSSYWIEGLWDTDRKYVDLNQKFKSVKFSVKPREFFQFYHDRFIFKGPTLKTAVPANIPDFWGLFSLDKEIYYHDKTGTFLHISTRKTTSVELKGDILMHPAWNGKETQFDILWNKEWGSTVCIRLKNSLYLTQRSGEGIIKQPPSKKVDFVKR
jgi:hypothetical protein